MLTVRLEDFNIVGVEGPMSEWKIDSDGSKFTATATSKTNTCTISLVFDKDGYILILTNNIKHQDQIIEKKKFSSNGCGIMKLGGGAIRYRNVGFINAATEEFLGKYGITNIRTFKGCGNIYYLNGRRRVHDVIYIPKNGQFRLIDENPGHHSISEWNKLTRVFVARKDMITTPDDKGDVYIELNPQDYPDFIIVDDIRKVGSRKKVKRHIIIESGDKVFNHKDALDEMLPDLID